MGEPSSWSIGRLLRHYLDIALLRRGPDDLPASQTVLVFTVAGCIVISLLASSMLPPTPAQPLVLLALDTAVMLLWVWMALRLAGKPERFLQTATGLFGVQLVLSPLFAVGQWMFVNSSQGDQMPSPPVAVLLFMIGLWALIVSARVLRAATGWLTPICIAVMLSQALLVLGLQAMIYPEAANAAL
ncbi:MAG: hypothetical protein LBE59_03830 [Nevskiaceae bacterium]|nr:hypothetical protein [Nevskiaceae bacterium]